MTLGQSLFRQEAIDFQRGQGDFNAITLLRPVSTKLSTSLSGGEAEERQAD